ncbi:hypothetical protein L345_15530, partial [Ophiophagus hannah]
MSQMGNPGPVARGLNLVRRGEYCNGRANNIFSDIRRWAAWKIRICPTLQCRVLQGRKDGRKGRRGAGRKEGRKKDGREGGI